MNTATFAGRLGRDPETRTTNSGSQVVNFSLAVDRYKKEDGALWVDVSVWGKQGENVQRYLSKGRQAVVTGRVDINVYEKRDGTTGASLTLNATDVTFIGSRDDDQGHAPVSDVPVDTSDFKAPARAASSVATDDIPFLCEPLPAWVAVKGTERA